MKILPHTPLRIKVPGKLMIVGEFAVLEPHYKSVVMAVDRFVYATLQQDKENQLTLESFGLQNLTWNYKNHAVTIDSTDKRLHFIQNAMSIALRYLEEKAIYPPAFSLMIQSELDDESGIKYGLGSSAAVVTSVISVVITKHLPISPSADLIFKLAAICHVTTQGNGSGADIAASAYGGMLEYSSFQADWLMNEWNKMSSLTELVEKQWTYLSVKRMKFPKKTPICIGWTGKPASTGKIVPKILKLKNTSPKQFQQFLTASKAAVDNFLEGIKKDNTALILTGIKQNRSALSAVGTRAGVTIETPLLGKLGDLAERFLGAGKPSGAGGGDCGIAFMPTEEQAKRLFNEWKQAGIKPLHMKAYPTGAKTVESS